MCCCLDTSSRQNDRNYFLNCDLYSGKCVCVSLSSANPHSRLALGIKQTLNMLSNFCKLTVDLIKCLQYPSVRNSKYIHLHIYSNLVYRDWQFFKVRDKTPLDWYYLLVSLFIDIKTNRAESRGKLPCIVSLSIYHINNIKIK